MSLSGVELIAHRGAPREFRENSIPAFQRAFERGAQAIELDVHATRDHVVVVHHDPVLRFPGRPRIVDLEWEQVREIELAPGIRVPLLADVLSVVPAGATAYIELKGAGVEAVALEVIRQSVARCAVHSFDHEMIVRARELDPEIPRGVLFDVYPTDIVETMKRTDATHVWPRWNLVDAVLVQAVHSRGGKVIAWTVNSPAAGAQLVGLGVDGLCTDDVRPFLPSG